MNAFNTSSLVTIFLFAACQRPASPQQPGTPAATARSAGDDLPGHYEYSSGNESNDVVLAVTIVREGDQFELGLGAWHPDGHGPAPDGGGVGTIDPDGTLRFNYEDSFSNKGTGTFKRTASGYALSIHIDDVQYSRCMPFYAGYVLSTSP